MLRRRSTTTSLPLAGLVRFCSTTTTQQQNNNKKSSSNPKVPEYLLQFDQLMKTNPQFRQHYPELLKAIVSKSRQDIVTVANTMIDATTTEDSKTPEKKQEKTEIDQEKKNEIVKAALNLIVIDVAFADMFYHAETEEVESTNDQQLAQEEADEELLELLLSYYSEDFKKQKARIGKFIIKAIQEERDQLMKNELGLKMLRESKNHNNNFSSSRKSSNATLPNFAITITPPIDSENTISASELLKQIKTELPVMHEILGGKQQVVTSVLKRRVFSGAVNLWDENGEEKRQVEEMTQSLFEKRKKKAIGDVEFDPDFQKLACQVAVEENFVNQKRKGEGSGEHDVALLPLIRFDIGIEENSFAKAIGLDLYFDFEKDGDAAVRKVEECANEICKRVSNRLNSGFRGEGGDSSFGEQVILPFAYTMRCKVMMK